MRLPARRRLLVVLALLTLGLLVADLAGSGVAVGVRSAGGTVFGPVQRVLAGAGAGEVERLEAENARLRARLADRDRTLDELGALRELLGAATPGDHDLVAARVVATSVSPLGGRGLTLDVGSRDGVAVDTTVVAAEGLVGRVVAVSPWTCDVQVVGSAGSVVGVRVGPAGTLGSVAVAGAGERESRPRGSLTLELIQPGTPQVGDLVRTLGSVDDRPYAAGLVVGTVTAVDPDRGRETRTATVRPSVDADAVDVVAVLLPRSRGVPREPVGATPTPTTSTRTISTQSPTGGR